MAEHGQTRFLIDWDNDGYIDDASSPADAVNLLGALIHPDGRFAGLSPALNLDYGLFILADRILDPDSYHPTLDPGQYGSLYWSIPETDGDSVGVRINRDWRLDIDFAGIPVQGDTTYTLYCRFRIHGESASISGKLTIFTYEDQYISLTEEEETLSIGDAGRWIEAAVEITTPANAQYVTALLSLSDETEGSIPAFDIAGVMLLEGSHTPPLAYNTGSPARHLKDITPDVMSAIWQSGFLSPVASGLAPEGVCEVMVENGDKRYSPENVNSDLHDYLRPGKRLFVQMYDANDTRWRPLWTGRIDSYAPDPFELATRTMRIHAFQGIQGMQEIDLPTLDIDEGPTGLVLAEVLVKAPWVSPSVSDMSFRSGMSIMGVNTYLADVNDIVGTLETGDVMLSEVNDRLAQNMQSAFARIAEHELGYIWVNRRGELEFRNRFYFDELAPIASLELGVIADPNGSLYTFGANVTNVVTVRWNGQEYIQEDNASLFDNMNPYVHSFSAELFSEEQQVQNFVHRYLQSQSRAKGEFGQIRLVLDSPIDLRMTLQPGVVVELEEPHVAMDGVKHLIVGERYEYRSRHTHASFFLRNIEDLEVFDLFPPPEPYNPLAVVEETNTNTVNIPVPEDAPDDLRVILYADGTDDIPGVELRMRINNDSGAVYDTQRFTMAGTDGESAGRETSETSVMLNSIPGDVSANEDLRAGIEIELYDHKTPGVFRMGQVRRATHPGEIVFGWNSFIYKDASPITSIQLFNETGDFANVTAVLYGLWR
jgi:hypothetical protein